MSLLALTELDDGRLEVSWQPRDGPPRRCPQPVYVSNPVSNEDRRELRWYLEDYLDFPMAVLIWQQNRPREAVAWYGRALTIAARYRMAIADRVLRHLTSLAKTMGAEEFTKAWRAEFPGQALPPSVVPPSPAAW